jgi:hypothetical protein
MIYQRLLLEVTLEIRISLCRREILRNGTCMRGQMANDQLPLLVGWRDNGIKNSAKCFK